VSAWLKTVGTAVQVRPELVVNSITPPSPTSMVSVLLVQATDSISDRPAPTRRHPYPQREVDRIAGTLERQGTRLAGVGAALTVLDQARMGIGQQLFAAANDYALRQSQRAVS
jgi:hypothetical protein